MPGKQRKKEELKVVRSKWSFLKLNVIIMNAIIHALRTDQHIVMIGKCASKTHAKSHFVIVVLTFIIHISQSAIRSNYTLQFSMSGVNYDRKAMVIFVFKILILIYRSLFT